MKRNKEKIRELVGLAMLSTLIVALQAISNYIPFGPVSITLALIPIVVGSIIYGPKGGLILGTVMGIMVCFAPSTMALFMPYSVMLTIIVCLVKSAVAGLVAGYIFKFLSKKNRFLAIVLASISVPLVNTGLFTVACYTLFLPLIKTLASAEAASVTAFLFLTMIGLNFLIEFATNSILSPIVVKIVDLYKKK